MVKRLKPKWSGQSHSPPGASKAAGLHPCHGLWGTSPARTCSCCTAAGCSWAGQKKKKKKQRKNKKEKSVVELGRSETFAALWLFGSKNSSWKGRELGESEAGEVTLPLRASVSPSVKIN